MVQDRAAIAKVFSQVNQFGIGVDGGVDHVDGGVDHAMHTVSSNAFICHKINTIPCVSNTTIPGIIAPKMWKSKVTSKWKVAI